MIFPTYFNAVQHYVLSMIKVLTLLQYFVHQYVLSMIILYLLFPCFVQQDVWITQFFLLYFNALHKNMA